MTREAASRLWLKPRLGQPRYIITGRKISSKRARGVEKRIALLVLHFHIQENWDIKHLKACDGRSTIQILKG